MISGVQCTQLNPTFFHELKISYLFSYLFLLLFQRVDAARSGDKYETSSTNSGQYSKHMKLKIRSIGPNDYGSYRCVAKNSLGETDGLIKLEGKIILKDLFDVSPEKFRYKLKRYSNLNWKKKDFACGKLDCFAICVLFVSSSN